MVGARNPSNNDESGASETRSRGSSIRRLLRELAFIELELDVILCVFGDFTRVPAADVGTPSYLRRETIRGVEVDMFAAICPRVRFRFSFIVSNLQSQN